MHILAHYDSTPPDCTRAVATYILINMHGNYLLTIQLVIVYIQCGLEVLHC